MPELTYMKEEKVNHNDILVLAFKYLLVNLDNPGTQGYNEQKGRLKSTVLYKLIGLS